jgi:hypothetical protein
MFICSHGVDYGSFKFCKKSIQWESGESRSPIQISQWDLLPAPHLFWANVCAFSLQQMEMMVMVMAIVIVMVIVIIVLEVLRHVGWLRQRQH